MRLFLFALVLLTALGCSHGGNVPWPGVPWCTASSHVQPCPGYPQRTIEATVAAALATCDDADYTLGCQVDNGEAYLYGVCVASCDSPPADQLSTADESVLEAGGVHLCAPRASRTDSWCATCDSLDSSLVFRWCDPSSGGACDPVVCVADCATCTPQ